MSIPLPNTTIPFVDMSGRLSQPWLYWFQSIGGPGAASSTVTVGASPFSFAASYQGNLLVEGGTVSAIDLVRGTTIISTGMTSGFIPVSRNDIVIITYTVLPNVTFIPS